MHHPPQSTCTTREFRYNGRRYTLFRRNRSPFWYIHIQHGKVRHKKSLETTVASVAVVRAKAWIETVRAGRWRGSSMACRGTPAPTVGDLISAYQQHASISARSVRNNVLALRQIIRTVDDTEHPDSRPVTADLPMKPVRYQEVVSARYVAQAEAESAGRPPAEREAHVREARDRAYRSSASTIHQAQSVTACLCRRIDSCPQFADCVGILDGFRRAHLLGSTVKSDYHPPSDSVLARAFNQIAALAETDQNAFLAFWLAAGAGLRRKEIAIARWEHLVERDGRTWFSGALGKDGRRIEVQMQSRAVTAIAPYRREAGKIISETGVEWARRLNLRLTDWGFTTTKKLHELRAYAGSLIYRQSAEAARQFLRHKSIRITEQSYVRYGRVQVPDVL